MAQNDIDNVLDQLRRIKSGGDLHVDKIDEIERLQMHIGIFRTFSKYNHVLLPKFVVKITKKAKLIVEMIHSVFGGIPDKCNTNLNLERLESQLLEFTEGNIILRYNYELNDSDLLEYMDCIDKNLNDVWMCLDKNLNDVIQMCLKLGTTDHSSTNEQFLQYNRFLEQVKIIQNKMRILRDLYATEINGYVDYDKLEGLETRFQFMADNVGQFCIALSYKLDEDKDDTDDIESKSPYLLSLVVLVELEMKKIFLDELKGSNFTQSRTFVDEKLPIRFSYYLYSLLMYLRNIKLENFPNNVSAQNIDVAIEFLLVFLDVDPSNHVINGNWLNEVMEQVGSIVGDILYAIQKLLPNSISKDDTSKLSLGSIHILEKTKDLKAQVETYYKSLKFIASQFPTFGGFSFK